jgi:beta-lactamase regulating signal transducer with metallopeptidase domain
MNMPLWFSNLVFWSAQVALLVLAAGFFPRLFQIRQPRVLLTYWRAILGISFALPFVEPWHRIQSSGSIAFTPDVGSISAIPASNPAVTHWHFPSLQIIAEILGVAILAGIAARFVILALGLLKLRQFRRASSPISLSAESAAALEEMRAQLRARAEFRLSTGVDSPVTFGLAAPVILLPERFLTMGAQSQAAIACHELLHVRRRDWAHHLAEETIRAAFWFHPAIAWVIERVRLAREQIVDLDVVRLTNARKPYLEALLEFTNARASIAAIPAPPFLAERQLVERVTLMLKEVRMSRTRLVASLTASSCCIALAIIFAVWSFPLRAAPHFWQDPPQSGVAQGASGGVGSGPSGGPTGAPSGGPLGGVTGGIGGGVSGGSAKRQHEDEPTVDQSTIWVDATKKGPMLRQVRGLGTLVRAEGSANLVARVTLPTFMTVDVRLKQNAAIATRKGPLANGHVSRTSLSPSNDTRSVDIALDAVPEGVGAGLEIDATIDIEKLENILYVGRPVHAIANSTVSLFKIVSDGTEAVRVKVKLGRSSVNTIEVLDGLQVGDKVILSDMSSYDNADRIHLIEEKHLSSR